MQPFDWQFCSSMKFTEAMRSKGSTITQHSAVTKSILTNISLALKIVFNFTYLKQKIVNNCYCNSYKQYKTTVRRVYI